MANERSPASQASRPSKRGPFQWIPRRARDRVALIAGAVLAHSALAAPRCAIAGPQNVIEGTEIELSVAGRYATSRVDQSASEISAYHARTKRLFVVGDHGVETLDVSDPTKPNRIAVWTMRSPTSVAVHGDIVAVAVPGPTTTSRGEVRLFDPTGLDLARVDVGFGPDMIAFTPDGRQLLVACEGEASPTDPSVDPPGTVVLLDLSRGVQSASVVELGFDAFESQRAKLVERGLRVVEPGKTLAQDLEPEFIALSPDGRFAFVTLQENNAIAIIDVTAQRVLSIEPLGYRDCAEQGMGFDAVQDGVASPRSLPVLALFQPDAIVAFEHDGALWLATANEGEARMSPFNEVVTLNQARRLLDLDDGSALPEGDLRVSCVRAPESFGAGLCAFGTRSVSLWRVSQDGLERTFSSADAPIITRSWDSGDAIERIVAARSPELFNADHGLVPSIDAQSLSKGPEPEGMALGEVSGTRLLFVALERSGGVVIIDVTTPTAPVIRGYANERSASAAESDRGPEGVLFIPSHASPNGRAMLVVNNEVSGTTTLFYISVN